MSRLITIFLSFLFLTVYGQKENKHIREGNEHYSQGNAASAETSYRKALEKNKASDKARFNLGDALYKQDKFQDAEKEFKALAEQKTNSNERSRVFHNLGNTLLQQKKYEESINAYKQALKANPADEDTRYNLAYAKAMLQQQNDQKKNDQKKDDQKKDDKNKEKETEKEKEKDKNKDNEKEKGKEKENEKEQPGKPQMDQQDARRMLEAINQEDKKIQDKLRKEKVKGRQVQIEKDW